MESLKAEQRLVIEKVVHGRDVFAQFNTDGIREELDISDLAPFVHTLGVNLTDQIVQERNQQTESLQCTTVEQHLKYKNMSYLH